MFDAIEKAGLNGLAAGAVTLTYFTPKAKVFMPWANSNVPLSAVAFGVGATGSLIGDLIHKYVIDDVDISEKWKHRTSLVTGLALNGGLFTGLLFLYDKSVCNDFGFGQAFGVGALAELAGSGSYNYLKENMII